MLRKLVLFTLLVITTACSQAKMPLNDDKAEVTQPTNTSDNAKANKIALTKGETPVLLESHQQAAVFAGSLSTKKEPQGLRVTLTITNIQKNNVAIHYRSGKVADLWAVSAKGKRLWAWSDAMMFTQALRNVVIDAGKQRVIDFIIPTKKLASFPDGTVLVAKYAGELSGTNHSALNDVIMPLNKQ